MEALAQALAAKVRRETPANASLRPISKPASARFDSITRASILQRVRYLQRAYNLQWLVEQATFDSPGLDCLDDQSLSALLRDIERARECVAEGISFDEAGLVKNTARILQRTEES